MLVLKTWFGFVLCELNILVIIVHANLVLENLNIFRTDKELIDIKYGHFIANKYVCLILKGPPKLAAGISFQIFIALYQNPEKASNKLF